MYYMIEPLLDPNLEAAYGALSVGNAVNASGDVAGCGYRSVSPPANPDYSDLVGVIWRNTAANVVLDAGASKLVDINAAGDAVGYSQAYPASLAGAGPENAILVRGGSVINLNDQLGAGFTGVYGALSWATGINDAGQVCGYAIPVNDPPGGAANAAKGFMYNPTAETITQIPLVPLAINQAGDTVGVRYAYIGSVLKDLGYAHGVFDINDSYQACGQVGDVPAIWTDLSKDPSTSSPLQLPKGYAGGLASAMNNHGDVVGTCHRPGDYSKTAAFLYSHSSALPTDLNSVIPPGTGWYLASAEDINDDGQITGWGFLNGTMCAFLLTPVPAPRDTTAEIVAWLIGAVAVDGPGKAVLPHGVVPVDPWTWRSRWTKMVPEKRNILIGLALDELASQLEDSRARDALRHASLDMVRGQVERLLQAPQLATRPRAEAMEFEVGRLLPRSLALTRLLHGQQRQS